MKKALTLITATILMSLGFNAMAQKKCSGEWKDKMMSEKIAFLTTEIGLTPEEAQVFWPVYNQIYQERENAMDQFISSFNNMRKAVNDNMGGKAIENAMNQYLSAQKKVQELDDSSHERYISVLPVEKVARLYLAEEKFRRQHIRKLKGNSPGSPEKK